MTSPDTTSAGTVDNGPGERSQRRTATVTLPFVTAEFRKPELRAPRLPGRRDMETAAQVTQSFLPPPQRLVYYAGLGALAALEVVEWPVAVAIAAGTAVASRTAGRTATAAHAGYEERTDSGVGAEPAPATGRGRGPGRRPIKAQAPPATGG
jgi:hypothetical protein